MRWRVVSRLLAVTLFLLAAAAGGSAVDTPPPPSPGSSSPPDTASRDTAPPAPPGTAAPDTTRPDSVRLRPAPVSEAMLRDLDLAARGMDLSSVSGRDRAAATLEALRPRYWSVPAYHLLRAKVAAAAGRWTEERRSYESAARLDSTSLQPRVLAGEALLRAMFRGYDTQSLDSALRWLREAVDLATPADSQSLPSAPSGLVAEALYWRSVALCLARSRLEVSSPEFCRLSREGIRLTRRLLSLDADDPRYLRMHAVNCTDAGEPEEAVATFRAAFKLMPPGAVDAFSLPIALAQDPDFKAIKGDKKREAMREYWSQQNEGGVDLVNQAQLAFWKNNAVAMLFEPEPWNSAVGQAMIVMGPPRFSFPTYREQGRYSETGVEMVFANGATLDGWRMHPSKPFELDTRSTRALVHEAEAHPTVPAGPSIRKGVPAFLLASSFPDRDHPGKTVLRCTLVARPWKGKATWRQGSFSIRLLSRGGEPMEGGLGRTLAPQDLVELPDNDVPETVRPAVLASVDFPGLDPGRYTVSGSLSAGDETPVFAERRPVLVRSFQGLRVSDPEPMARQGGVWKEERWEGRPYLPTAPVGVTGGSLALFFTVTGLVERDGKVRYRSSHVVVRSDVFQRDLDDLARTLKNEDLARFSDANLSGPRLLRKMKDYPGVTFPDREINTRYFKGDYISTAAVLPALPREEGAYVCLTKVRDLNSESADSVACSVFSFRVVSPEELEGMLPGRRR